VKPGSPPWASRWLIAVAVDNLGWGAFLVLSPATPFEWSDTVLPRNLSILQCVGMIVGVYGVGYAVALRDPLRHWPIVLVGLLGKILGPIGFAQAAAAGELPWRFDWTILTNDLIWWPRVGCSCCVPDRPADPRASRDQPARPTRPRARPAPFAPGSPPATNR
jgi:hypothetical protein